MIDEFDYVFPRGKIPQTKPKKQISNMKKKYLQNTLQRINLYFLKHSCIL